MGDEGHAGRSCIVILFMTGIFLIIYLTYSYKRNVNHEPGDHLKTGN